MGTDVKQVKPKLHSKMVKNNHAKIQIDPRLDARRKSVREEQRKKRLRIWLTLLGVVIVLSFCIGILTSPLLSVKVIRVNGNLHESRTQLLAISGLNGHPQMVVLDISGIEQRVNSLPWVKSTTIIRNWPDGVTMNIDERTPIATSKVAANRWLLIDSTGRVLGDSSNQPSKMMVIDAGIGSANFGSYLGERGLEGLTVIENLSGQLVSQVNSIGIASDGSITLSLNPVGSVFLGNLNGLEAKLSAASAVLSHVNLKSGQVLDVSIPESPIVS